MPKGKSIIGACYADLIPKVGEAIKEIRRGKLSLGVLFHHDNARAHRAEVALTAIRRADLITHQIHQVHYVDYGNRCWILERNVRELDMAYVVLPFQAVRARLATVVARDNIDDWAAATELLRNSALNKMFNALIVSTEADEMSVVLFNEHGCDIAEHAATMGLIQIIPYNIQYKHYDESNTSKSNRVRLIPG